jgi:hypothetical protein
MQKLPACQVKLKSIVIAKGGLAAKPLESKIQTQKAQGSLPNLLNGSFYTIFW